MLRSIPQVNEHDSFIARFKQKFHLRLHMTMILLGTTATGVIVNKLLFLAGMHTMMERYPLLTVAAYAVFLVLVRIWLWIVLPGEPAAATSSSSSSRSNFKLSNATDGIGLPSGGGGGGYSGGGGGFSGGGASANWSGAAFNGNAAGELETPMLAPVADQGGSALPSTGGAKGFSLDFDGDTAALLLVLAAVVVICGAGVFLVVQAPAILGESAFQVALGGVLARRAHQLHQEGWATGLFKATWKPFAVLLVLAVAFSWGAHALNPDAHRVVDLFDDPAQR